MPGCAVATCKNTNRNTRGTGIKYFSFPQNEDLAMQWIQACRREDRINLKHARICSVHFEADSFEIPMRQRLLQYNPINSRNLKSDAVPALHLCSLMPKVKSLERPGRMNKTTQHETVTETLRVSSPDLQESTSNENCLLEESNVQPMASVNVKTKEQTEEHETNELGELRKKIEKLEKKNEELLQQVCKYENALAEVFTPRQTTIHAAQQHKATVETELITSDRQLTCGISRTQSSHQQLISCVTDHIKQELADEQCFSEVREDYHENLDGLPKKVECKNVQAYSASQNSGMYSSFTEDEWRRGISTKLVTSIIKPVINEEDQLKTESVFAGTISLPTIMKQEEE